jgi:serine/threonine-protein kinase RsbW
MPSRKGAIAGTVERVLEAAQPAGLDDDQRLDLSVAVAEALSNAAVHGNRLRPGSLVTITVAVVPGRRVRVEVKDSGGGFDASRLHDPTEPNQLLTPSGRGVFLMRRLVDEVEFLPPGNRICLTLNARR